MAGCNFIRSKSKLLLEATKVEREFADPTMVSCFLTRLHDSLLNKARQLLVSCHCYSTPLFSLTIVNRTYLKTLWNPTCLAIFSKGRSCVSCWMSESFLRRPSSFKHGRPSSERGFEQQSSKSKNTSKLQRTSVSHLTFAFLGLCISLTPHF